MKLFKAFAIGAVLAAGAAFAQEDPTDPSAIARSDLMKMVGMNTGILGNMAGGKDPYDAAKAEGAKAALIEASAKIEATFMEQGGADPVSEAKPEIWANWEDLARSMWPRPKASAPGWGQSVAPARIATPPTA